MIGIVFLSSASYVHNVFFITVTVCGWLIVQVGVWSTNRKQWIQTFYCIVTENVTTVFIFTIYAIVDVEWGHIYIVDIVSKDWIRIS